jgi:hypothetical protein
VPEFIDPVFANTSQKRSFAMTENERFGLVFATTGAINSGTGIELTFAKIYFILFIFIVNVMGQLLVR